MHEIVFNCTYNVGRPLNRDVLFCFLLEVPVTILAAAAVVSDKCWWNMTKMIYKTLRMRGRPKVCKKFSTNFFLS